MTSRPQYTHKRRPLSAIFLGPITNTPPDLPSLPEPPSPGAHSSGSGLPSPPATNSTGSGSTGDNSTHGGSLRRRAASDANATPEMLNKYDRSFGSGSTVSSPEDEGGFDDEDTTAKMANGRRRQASAENAIALQRVRSLTERNRMALDKLSRLNTPSPSTMSRSSRSPLPALTGPGPGSSDSGRSSSRLSHHTHTHSAPTGRDRANTRSGSETERESQQPSSSYYSSDDQSETPPSSLSHAHLGSGRFSSRRRGGSLPDSPETRRSRDRSRGSSPGPSQRTPRKRAAIASTSDRGRDYGQDTTHDVTTAALAAVASMRHRSPSTSGGKRSRQPLPKEFRESKRSSLDGRPPSQPTTPHRDRHYVTSRNTPSPKASSANSFYHNQVSPRPQRTRFSTVRELTRRHQTRWVSEDLSNVISSAHEEEDDENYMERPMSSGGRVRQQMPRGGSGGMEHSVGTRLVGGSLRAAGIGMRHANDEDVFRAEEQAAAAARGHRRPRSNGTPSVRSSEWDEGQSTSTAGPSRTTGSSRASDRLYDPRTPANTTSRFREERGAYTGPNLTRPATSMADYHHGGDMPPPRTAPQALRTYKSTYAFERDREGIGSEANSGASGSRDAGPSRQAAYSLPPLQAPNLQERTYGSPRVRMSRLNGKQKVLSAADEAAIEHLKLMDDSLVVFETLLSRLPPMGNTTTSIIPELFRDAQSIVRYSEQVNGMLRNGTNRALERQIEREIVDESEVIDMVQLWRDVGNDFRDCMRVSDELVRTMTGFLIGVGKVLRDSGSTTAGLQHHLRAASMDEDAARRLAGDGRSATGSGTGSGPGSDKRNGPGSDKRSSTDGGRSAETRRSWDLVRLSDRERDKDRDRETLRRSSSRMDAIIAGNRPSSSLLKERDNQPVGRRIDLGADSPLPAPAPVPASVSRNGLSSLTVSSSTRRLYTPRDRDEHTPNSLAKIGLATIQSQESMHDYEPSPTPAPRVQPQSSADRRALALAPLSIPAPLPALPSEYQLSRRVSAGSGPRKISTASNVTVRANTGISVTTPSTTTAVTPHTVSNNFTPDKAFFPQTRGEPSSSTLSRKPNVTFSRPSTISVNALNGLAQRDTTRRRTNSQSSSEMAVHDEPISATSAPLGVVSTPVARTPRSGSDTERPSLTTIGRRTLGPRGRVSLDEAREGDMRRSGDRSGTSSQAQTMVLPSTRKERRRTITEIFS